jgi:hypothetical protein
MVTEEQIAAARQAASLANEMTVAEALGALEALGHYACPDYTISPTVGDQIARVIERQRAEIKRLRDLVQKL